MTFSIQAKRDTFPEVLELLRQVLREPALPAAEFEVTKRERLAMMEQMRTEPSALAPRRLQRELTPYPKEDIRYTPTVEESVERVQAVTYEQVATLYREFLGAQEGELTIVGDFDAQKCLPILGEALRDWVAPKPYQRIAMPIPAEVPGAEYASNTPDKANATYVAGLIFPLRDDDPDYSALVMGNYIFGSGALSSRLGDRIRQKEGLSYGVSSGLSVSSLDKRAILSITAISNPISPVAVTICAIRRGPNMARSWKNVAMVLIRKIGMSGSSAIVMLPIVVSSRTLSPASDEAVDVAGVRVAAAEVVAVSVVPAGADWVHPAENRSAAARRPTIQNIRIGDILVLSVLPENRDYGE